MILRIISMILIIYGGALLLYIPYLNLVQFLEEVMLANLIFRALIGSLPGFVFIMIGYLLICHYQNSKGHIELYAFENKIVDILDSSGLENIVINTILISFSTHVMIPIFYFALKIIKLIIKIL